MCPEYLSGGRVIPSADRLWHSHRGQRLNLLPCFWFRELRIRWGLTVVGSLWRYGVDDLVRSLHVALNIMSLHSSCSLDTEVRLVPPAVFSLGAPRPVLSSSKPNIVLSRSFRPPIKLTLGLRCCQSLGIICCIVSRTEHICWVGSTPASYYPASGFKHGQ